MKKLRIAVLLVTVISLLGLVLACPTGGGGSSGSVTPPPAKETPSASDYNISGNGTFVAGGTPAFVKVNVTPKEGLPDVKDIFYAKVTPTGTETPVTAVPASTAVGVYAVTFDVKSNDKYNAVNGLSAGLVNITDGSLPYPVLDDFDIIGFPVNIKFGQTPTPVSITPKANKTGGRITIIYTNEAGVPREGDNRGSNFPTAIGLYDVSFKVDADPDKWNAAIGLTAGAVLINPADGPSVVFIETTFDDFYFKIGDPAITFTENNNEGAKAKDVEYNVSALPVSVTSKAAGPTAYPIGRFGAVTFTYFDVGGETEQRLGIAPSDKGKYKVEIELAGLMDPTVAWTKNKFTLWFNIIPRVPRASDYVITKWIQAEKGTSWQAGSTVTVQHLSFTRKTLTSLVPDEVGISSPYRISIYYEGTETVGGKEVKIGPVVETATDNVFPATGTNEPPQNAGSYEVYITVAAPTAAQNQNWAGLTEKLRIGTLELKKLVPVDPAFENLWIDENKGVLSVTSSNDDFLILPEGSITFNVTGSADVLEWRVDSAKQLNADGTVKTDKSFTFTSKAVGQHKVSLIVTLNKKLYSKTIDVRVVPRS